MKTVLLLFLAALLLAVVALLLWRQADRRADRAEVARLLALQPATPALFDPAMVRDLPAPARRYFEHAIRPGTPLFTVAEIAMTGRFGLGDKADPGYLEMTATQVLAPRGFVWSMRGRRGAMAVSGSDTGDWTRFWALGLLPVARSGGTGDHRRSAFGRSVSEAVFWTPAALLPGPGIVWEALDDDTARVTVTRDGLRQSVDLTVDAKGRATQVRFDRWTNANPGKVWRLQPFGGILSDERDFHGFRLPGHVEAGNHFGTEAYFPFFITDVAGLRFPAPRP